MHKGQWSALAIPGTAFSLRVTPRARKDEITFEGGQWKVRVTALPEDGKANAAVAELLAGALGVARTRLRLLRGATSRDKVFGLDT